MTSTRPAPARRRRALLTLTPLVLLVPLLAPTTAAQAAKPAPAPPPPPITLVVTDIASSVLTPTTPGAPVDFLAVGEPFSLSVDFRSGGALTPISANKAVTLSVSVVDGTSTFGSATTVTVDKGATFATFDDLVLTKAANNVRLRVTATAPARDTRDVVPGFSALVDVASDFTSVDGFDGKNGVSVSREGVGVACTATPERPTCVDLILPASDLNGDLAFFSTGVCDLTVNCEADRIDDRDVLQVLAEFDFTTTPARPATLVVKCDKDLCGGGGIKDTDLRVSTAASGELKVAADCSVKGVVNAGEDFCVDRVQSKRDGAGDTILYLLMLKDARMSI